MFDCIDVFEITNISSATMDEDCKFLSAGATSSVGGVRGSEPLGRSLKKEMALFYI